MPLLAYCMTAAALQPEPPFSGVNGSPVESMQVAGVQCFFSQVAENQTTGARPKEEALAFHRVLQDVFALTAILPFRFPTIVEGESELVAFIEEHASEYRKALARLRDAVQMEIRITSGQSETRQPQSSGGEYLRRRLAEQRELETVAQALRQTSAFLVRGWLQRDASGALRCFILLDRGRIAEFQTALGSVQISSNLSVRVSGPWPATEFVKED